MQAIRVAAIGRTGRGDWGHDLDRIWSGMESARLVAVADDGPDGPAEAVARNELPADAGFADWRRMIAAVKPDVVAICQRWIDAHAEMAIAAAEAGVRGIFMEKPFVPTRAQADAVIAACRKSDTKLGLAYANRHAPAYAQVRDLIEDGRIGKVLELRGRGKEDARGGGEDLWVTGCHILDLMADLGGAPLWCSAHVTAKGRPIGRADAVAGPEGIGLVAGDAIAATFGLGNGPTGYFASVREAGLKQPNFGLTIVGTKGAIHIRPDHVPYAYLREAPLWRLDKPHPWKPIGAEGVVESLTSLTDAERSAERANWSRRAASDLLAAIAEEREPETGMFAGRTTVEMTVAVYASALSGRRIDWPLAAELPSLADAAPSR
jgi:predicted dehydrogenase